MNEYLAEALSRHGLKLPHGYLTVQNLGLVNLYPWRFLSADEIRRQIELVPMS